MCGRTACTLAPDDVLKACSFNPKKTKGHKGKDKQKPVWRDPPGGQQYYPSYNIAPGTHTPVIISSQHYTGELDIISERVVQPMRWGLVPSWHKGDPKNVGYETNNCRAEGMLEKKTYKIPLEKGRRCVVLADGFYEWKRDKDKKQPYFIYFPQNTWVKKEDEKPVKSEPHDSDETVKTEPDDLKLIEQEPKHDPDWNGQDTVDGNFNVKQEVPEMESSMKEENGLKSDMRLLTIAGVFDIWSPPDNSAPIYSYSVITVESSPVMSAVHHRMPAFLSTDEEIEEWLNYGEVPLRKAIQCIHPSGNLQMHPVTTAVGNSRYKSPDCVQPIDLKKPKTPVNSFMKNWLVQPKKECSNASQISPNKSPPKKNSPHKQSKSSNLMMNWLTKGKMGPEETDSSVVKKFKMND